MRQKNIFKKWLAGACLLAIASCAELTPVQNQTEENVSGQGTRIEVLGLRTETDTKVTLSGTTFAWQAGDKIAVWTGTDESHGSFQECTVAANGSLSVTLEEGKSRFNYALYPANILYKGKDYYRVTLPNSYDYDTVCGDNVQTPMIAVNDNSKSELVFYNLASMLRLTVTLPKRTVKMKVKFNPDNKVNGSFQIESDIPIVVGTTCISSGNRLNINNDGANEISITGIHDIPANDSTITVNIPIPVSEGYNDFSVSAWDSEGKAIKAEIVHLATDYNATRAHGKKITTALTQGTFAISGNKYCIISPANLMYDGTKEAGKRFVFHEHASDVSAKLAYEDYSERAIFDTFPYGSSGYNDKNPWNRNTRADYTNLQTTSADWGVYNEISSYKKKTWVTALKEDWQSLIDHHIKATASLDGHKGYILIPIDYSGPTIEGGMHSNVDNVYTTTPTDNWTPVKEAGAAFLPFESYWTGTNGSTSEKAWRTINQNNAYGSDTWHFLKIEEYRGGTFYVRLINIL